MEDSSATTSYPIISILVAARNEENTIISCLQAITRLDYPANKLEVWIGDDDSTDKTHDLVSEFIREKDNFFLKRIKENKGSAKGKANVLAHLTHQANGELFCLTDADVEVPSSWLKALLLAYQDGLGMITGITSVKGESLFAKLQAIDWLHALSLIKLASDVGHPVTAMGNNLLISRKAYFSVGGYESIPFSVTEDFELFRQIRKKGWKVRQLFNYAVLAKTQAMPNWKALFQQRKRWMVGAMQVPWYIKMVLSLQVILYPILVLLLFLNPSLGITVWLSKALLQGLWILWHLTKIKQYKLLPYLALYEPYFTVVSIGSAIYNYLPIAIEWKGRVYHQ